ncbi:MAG: hypothetical protein ACQSGP_01400 [Frankia sp.]
MNISAAATYTGSRGSPAAGPTWRQPVFGRGLAAVRIAFGIAWAIDASFKWMPSFRTGFVSYLTDAKPGQPELVKIWISGCVNMIKMDPHLCAYLVAITESLIALCLIFGAFTNLVAVVGGLLSLGIWSTAEGFGGPYQAGSTDIGASIIYVILFAALAVAGAGAVMGADTVLRPRLGRWSWLSSRAPGNPVAPAPIPSPYPDAPTDLSSAVLHPQSSQRDPSTPPEPSPSPQPSPPAGRQ